MAQKSNGVSDKGERFLRLIGEQSNVQWSIVANLSRLIQSGWNLADAKAELESLVKRHKEITEELNGIDRL